MNARDPDLSRLALGLTGVVITFNEIALGNLLEQFSLLYVALKFVLLPAWVLTAAGYGLARQDRPSTRRRWHALAIVIGAALYVAAIIRWPLPWAYVADPDWRPVMGWAAFAAGTAGIMTGIRKAVGTWPNHRRRLD